MTARELLTLDTVAEKPDLVTSQLASRTGEEIIFRPLMPDDANLLAEFLRSLSPQTRNFRNRRSYDLAEVQEMCDAISRCDKLRMIAVVGERVVALFEFSLAIVASDKERFHGYGIELEETTTCRFGPCIADDWQNKGAGSDLLPSVLDIARRFGKHRVILWGGVFVGNHGAIRYYEKTGFRMLGMVRDSQGRECRDGVLEL